MPTRLEEILIRARDTLSDPNAERWTDARLLRLADDAQKAIANYTGLLRKTVSIPVSIGTALHSLPDDTHKIIRVTNEFGEAYPLVTHEYADKMFGLQWEQKEGIPAAIVFDKLTRNTFRAYPTPNAAAVGTVVPTTPVYGVVSNGGVIASNLSSPYGVVTGFQIQVASSFEVTYLAKPADLVTITDIPIINSMYDRAMKFYITGMALRDDRDVQNRQIGNEELQFFQAELRLVASDNAQDFTGSETQYEALYDSGGI